MSRSRSRSTRETVEDLKLSRGRPGLSKSAVTNSCQELILIDDDDDDDVQICPVSSGEVYSRSHTIQVFLVAY